MCSFEGTGKCITGKEEGSRKAVFSIYRKEAVELNLMMIPKHLFCFLFQADLAEMTNKLFEFVEVPGKAIFIVVVKIKASANKYTFVWKKAVMKNYVKLLIKLADLIAEWEQLYHFQINI